jgi:hypothetical protein
MLPSALPDEMTIRQAGHRDTEPSKPALLKGALEQSPESADLLVITGGNLDLDQVQHCEASE